MTSDEQLILQFQGGAADAFEQLFDRYRQPIWAFFRRRLDDPSRAEELAQDTFLAIVKGIARYEPRASFRTYLYAIALNLLRAERRAARRAPVDAPASTIAVTSDPEPGMWVKQAIGRLDESEREIILLREYEQLSYEEIAALVHLPLNTVRSRLFRARAALKALLAGGVQVSKENRP